MEQVIWGEWSADLDDIDSERDVDVQSVCSGISCRCGELRLPRWSRHLVAPWFLAVFLLLLFAGMVVVDTVWALGLSLVALHLADRLDQHLRPHASRPLILHLGALALVGCGVAAVGGAAAGICLLV